MDLETRFNNLVKRMKEPSFVSGADLANEVNYYIFAYDAAQELLVENLIGEKLLRNPELSKLNVQELDLYDIMINKIESLNNLADDSPFKLIAEMERRGGLELVAKQLNNVLKMDKDDNVIVEEAKNKLSDQKKNHVLLITGVGKVFPIIRAHKVLNTMHQIIDTCPVIMFYPGTYDELSLSIFGEVKDQNYYRAFKL